MSLRQGSGSAGSDDRRAVDEDLGALDEVDELEADRVGEWGTAVSSREAVSRAS